MKKLIKKSYYGSIGYVATIKDLELLESYIAYNEVILKQFKGIIVATNYADNGQDLRLTTEALWKKYFPEAILLHNSKNRGHNFGTADLDNMLVDYCKSNQIDWLCKSANDIILQESILNKQVGEADFYYLNGIGFGGMVKYDFDFDRIINEDFYPQTNFYFINVSKIDYLNNHAYIDETYDVVNNTPNYNGKVWEYIQGWSCETFLSACVKRNNLKLEHLIPEEKYRNLLSLVKNANIHDCSHKNIVVEGVCHLHFPNQSSVVI
jgi:hypothetical protein